MRHSLAGTARGLVWATVLVFAPPALAQSVPANIAAAVADPGRPAADTARDTDRKPAESVAFSGMKPGDRVADFLPGGGYFTRIFAKVVGPTGHVYAVLPQEFVTAHPRALDEITKVATAYPNVTVLVRPYSDFGAPEKLDIVWTSLNYHDLHNPNFGPSDVGAFDKAVFGALKPGGRYIVIDHAAASGAGFSVTQTLHRSDPEAVKKEVEGAGFVLDGQSDILHRPYDDHTKPSGAPDMRDKTDQYALRFRKPG